MRNAFFLTRSLQVRHIARSFAKGEANTLPVIQQNTQ
jgi:hypothetical protein